MRILASRFAQEVGGAEKSYFAHLKGFDELGHEVLAFTNLPLPSTVSVPSKNAFWFRSSNPLFKLIIALPQLVQCLWLVVMNRIDVINAHSRFDQVAFTLLKPLHRRPVVWKDPLEVREHLAKPDSTSRRIYVRALSRADAVYVLSESQKRDLLPRLPKAVDEKRVVVIPSGLDFSRYDLEAEPGFRREGIVAGYAARLHPAKGIDHLLHAAKEVVSSNPGFHLLIMGEGEHQEELQTLSRQLGLEQTVEFLPYGEDISPFLRSLDIYVCPSLYESWGLGVHEARLFGLPIVASQVGGLEEQIVDGENGLLVGPGDPKALAEALIKLMNDEDLAARLGKAACQSAIEQGDFSATIESRIIPLLEGVTE